MPVIENGGVKLVVFGTGDVGMAILADKNSEMKIVTFSPMEKSFKLGDSPGVEEVFTNEPVVSFGFYNKEGVQNLVGILQQIQVMFD